MPDPREATAPRPPEPFLDFARQYPAVVEAYERLAKAIREAGPLSAREAALVKLGISIGARMEGATHSHARKALAQGVDAGAVEQVALLACPTIGFPNMMMARGWVLDVIGGR